MMFDSIILIFIPLIVGSIIGLGFVLMLLSRLYSIPIERHNLFDRVVQNLANQDREKAILMLEEDNHPISVILAFTFKLSVKNIQELKDAYEYAAGEIWARLTHGSHTLAWLSIAVPLFTLATWFVLPDKPPPALNVLLIGAIIAEIIFWNVTLFYVKQKSAAIVKRAEEHFKFLSGIMIGFSEDETAVSNLVDETKDIVEISEDFKEISDAVAQKSEEEVQ